MSDAPRDASPSALSRRQLIAAMAATAGAFMVPRPAEAAMAMRTAMLRAGAAGGSYAPKVFTDHEWATVRLLVDYLIPRDDVSGAATDALVPEFMDTMLDLEPEMSTPTRGGLAWLDSECQRRFSVNFVDCAEVQRRQVLDDLAWPQRARPALAAGVAWFSSFRDFTATGFFTSEMGVKDLGYQGNTALPEWTGCPEANYQRLGVTKPL